MIFVTVGTNETPFDRLLLAVAELPLLGGEELVVQHGSSKIQPIGAQLSAFLPFERLTAEVQRARVVVTHAGVGSVIVAVANGRRPVVMPRLRRHGEAVDDHQLAFAWRFERMGLVTVVETRDQLEAAVRAPASGKASELTVNGTLVDELRTYLGRYASGGRAQRAGVSP